MAVGLAFVAFASGACKGRGPEAAPDHAEASASLKNALRPRVFDSPTANAVLGR